MSVKEFIIFALILGIFRVSQAQYYGRMRGLNSFYKDHCSCSCEDLSSIIALARAVEEKDATPPPPPPPPMTPSSTFGNFEELIMKLVNALVYTTTETTKNTYRCPHSIPPSGSTAPNNQNGGYTGGNEMTTSSSSHYSHSDSGLISIDVLNSHKNSNVLDVDVSNQHLVGVGLGGRGYDGGSSPSSQSSGQHPTGNHPSGQHPPSQYPSAQHPSSQHPSSQYPSSQKQGNSGEGLIDLDLLNSQKKDNVLELDLGKQKVLGIGAGGSPAPGNNGYTNNAPNSGEGLVNLDLLNQQKNNNVLDLDLVEQNLVGVGVGN